MKTLVIINESFAEMLVGKNNTLAYILVASEFSEVYIQNLAQNSCVKLEKNQAEILIKIYQEINQKIRQFVLNIENIRVKELITEVSCEIPEISINDLIVQRLEPMKAPFPPVGEENLDEFLLGLRKKFPQHIFNCSIGLHDKDLQDLSDIATPTAEFNLRDENLVEVVELMGDVYERIYQNSQRKVVIKPKDLAQSLGVFSLNLSEKYDIHQACLEHGEKFFRGQILVQPFLEGIRQGDIRSNIIKNQEGDFEVAGFVFRKSLRTADDKNFTTGFIVGGSTIRPISDLSKIEQEDLLKKSAQIIEVLNGKLRDKYRDVIELGADFILVGNGREVLLGEINHHCPGLLPMSEAMREEDYEKGFGLIRKLLKSCKKKW